MAEKATQQSQNSSASKSQKPAVSLNDQVSLHSETAQVVKHFSENINPNEVLQLQRTLGNHAVKAMLQRAGAGKKSGMTDEPAMRVTQEVSPVQRGMVQRAVDKDGVPT